MIDKKILTSRLKSIGLNFVACNLEEFLLKNTETDVLSLLDRIASAENSEITKRSLDNRYKHASLGNFKHISKIDWNWYAKVDRLGIEDLMTLDFMKENKNVVFIGNEGLGKTDLAKNIANQAILAGHQVLFISASTLIEKIANEDSVRARNNKIKYYTKDRLLCIDEFGYHSFDAPMADLLFQIIHRRYERGSIVLTTNRIFKNWNEVFPGAACINAMIDRIIHHSEIFALEGRSYRQYEAEQELIKKKTMKKTGRPSDQQNQAVQVAPKTIDRRAK